MRELVEQEQLPRNGKPHTYKIGSWVIESAFEAERVGRAIQTALQSERPQKITHPVAELDGTGREIETFLCSTRDEREFLHREWGAPTDWPDRGHGPLVVEPDLAILARRGLEICIKPPLLGEAPIDRHVSVSAAQTLLDIVDNRLVHSRSEASLRSVA